MKKKRVIRNAWDAYWFLYEHPKMNVQERSEVTPDQIEELKKEGVTLVTDPSGKVYRIWHHIFKHAMECNLDIFYTKVNRPTRGRVDKDVSKNKYVECWLEFGPIYYGYSFSGTDKPMAAWDDTTMLHHSHDYRLDTGGRTFDEGLIRLAKNVMKFYGDYDEKRAEDESTRWCGKPVCECSRWKKKEVKKNAVSKV